MSGGGGVGDHQSRESAVAPHSLPYTRDRLLMAWRYPDGVGTKRIEEKEVPAYAPVWIPRAPYKGKDWVLVLPSIPNRCRRRPGLHTMTPSERE
jgi:hypothetical protein